MVERVLSMDEVAGSMPATSTLFALSFSHDRIGFAVVQFPFVRFVAADFSLLLLDLASRRLFRFDQSFTTGIAQNLRTYEDIK